MKAIDPMITQIALRAREILIGTTKIILAAIGMKRPLTISMLK